MKILVVEDDKELSSELREHLGFKKHFVEVASTLREASELLDKSSFNLMLLDYKLGLEDGLKILNKLKCYTQTPVVVLMTSFATKEVAIRALNYGVFKFLEKPFLPQSIDDILDEMEVDRSSSKINLAPHGHVAIEDGKEVELTELEYKILSFLLENQNQLVTKSELHRYVYSSEIKARNALNTHLSNLKNKLSDDFTRQLKTIRSKGYIFETDT
ncbi:MAG: hypothetical protein CMJ16_05020 [Peredibacter sp.]|nr:hypothetical protein [Peredibacter sp.]